MSDEVEWPDLFWMKIKREKDAEIERLTRELADAKAEAAGVRAALALEEDQLAQACDQCDRFREDASHWRFQARAARLVCQMFVEEFDRADSTTIEPSVEMIDAARLQTQLLEKDS